MSASAPETGFRRMSDAMMDELEKDPAFLPSAFWRDINNKNMAMLEADGIDNFKRTLSQNYYNWLITYPFHPQLKHLFRGWLTRPALTPFTARLEDIDNIKTTISNGPIALNWKKKLVYRTFVALVWDAMRREDRAGLWRSLSEPEIGNPIRLRQGGRLISQDLANSIVECGVIADCLRRLPPQAGRAARVAEIGAGSGRLAHVFAATQPGQYFIFDIPPALFVSQWYLSQIFGEEAVFRFRPFARLEDVADEMAKARVVFLTSNQIRLFPDRYFDVVASISTLPEMRPDQVTLFIEQFRRLARGHVFLKQWNSWRNDLDGYRLSKEDVDLGSDFELTLDRTDPINIEFFNRAWRRRDAA
ncbi:MAG: putative sugar O-methyltransferase [Beijerinckiaceae bacterium]